ncbi:hypothetical protein [Myxococcus qinghaiensis]|uniref:hypothetical protein n=1 Tax=Myxococcus qinghaiensis TaxID=2906758 RepID=UPI0020A7C666|nr:hypothetical protein [Myxococcus qinghaiensis]MCP3168622.1 hypothetical protein [Myxococcus qinghaiensis]
MKSVLIAALLVQMTTAGGAGARDERANEHVTATEEDWNKHLSALKQEVDSVSEQFRVARERRRVEAERQKRESGEWTNEPTTPAPSPSKRALAPAGGAGTPAP